LELSGKNVILPASLNHSARNFAFESG